MLLVDSLWLVALHQTDCFAVSALCHDELDAFDSKAVRKFGKDLNLKSVDLVILDFMLLKAGSAPQKACVLNLAL